MKLTAKQRELKIRVESALTILGLPNTAWSMPDHADINGPYEDLAHVAKITRTDIPAIGELALDGRVRPVRGIISLVEGVRDAGYKQVLVPTYQGRIASIVEGIKVRVIEHVQELLERVPGMAIGPSRLRAFSSPTPELLPYGPIKPWVSVLEALAKSEPRKLLLVGGEQTCREQTYAARAFSGIMPALTDEQALEVARIQDRMGLLESEPAICRPFRAPHYTVSETGMSGEVELAKHGVLYLDEANNFRRAVLEKAMASDSWIIGSISAPNPRLESQFDIVIRLTP